MAVKTGVVPGRFMSVLTQAIADFVRYGFDNIERLEHWTARLREAAEYSMESPTVMRTLLHAALRAVYEKLVEQGRIVKFHPGVEGYILSRLRPELHATLARHIHASADLIKRNRDEMIEKTLRRFSGWASSIPPGGAAEPDRRKAASEIKRGIAGLKFQERRVLIDQGHKLNANISRTVAEGGGALGGYWFSHWRQPGYNYREDHKERDGVFYVLRGNWAMEQGYMKLGGHKYTDEITQPAEEVFCRCLYTYAYHLRDIPDECITAKGQRKLDEVQAYLAKTH
jgi:hypothetical protein